MYLIERRCLIFLFCGLSFPPALQAVPPLVMTFTPVATGTPAPVLPEVVVTANRLQVPVSQAASSVEVITAEEMKKKQVDSVLGALREVPGLDIVLSGSRGQNSSVFIRGANSEHTLVLLDGIPLNDPISTGRLFEGLDQISTEDIDRIEVVRGPQSPLYGSNALGGVINILTRRGGEGLQGSLLLEGGEYRTFRGLASVSGGTGQDHFSLSASRFDTGGFSTADSAKGNKLPNGDRNDTVSFRFESSPLADWTGDLLLRYNGSHTALDGYQDSPPYAFVDDPNYFSDGRQFVVKGGSTLKLLDGAWEQALSLSYSENTRKYSDDPDGPSDLYGYSRSTYRGSLLQAEMQNNLRLSGEETLVLGLQALREWGYDGEDYGFGLSELDATADTGGIYLESQTSLDQRLFATLGGRLDVYSSYGTHPTYRAGLAYFLPGPGTKLKATYGSGFKTPSLYQLYSIYGDPGLRPEESKGWDIGFEQGFLEDKLRLGVTYFHNDFDRLINFDLLSYTYVNVDRATTQGWETSFSAAFLEGFSLWATYTHTDPRNEATGETLLRRPWDKANLDLSYHQGKMELGTSFIYVGPRKDLGDSGTLTMPEYFLVNARAAYRLDGHLRLFGRVENLLDRSYEEIFGYGTARLSVFVGTEFSL